MFFWSAAFAGLIANVVRHNQMLEVMQIATWINAGFFNVPFFLTGLVLSLFHGIMATNIFVADKDKSDRSGAWYFHQFWLNFCGSVAGWTALWFIVQKIALVLALPATAAPQLSDIALFFLAFLGVTGYLPFAILTTVGGIKELLAKLPGFAK
jgi:hypothetical protein